MLRIQLAIVQQSSLRILFTGRSAESFRATKGMPENSKVGMSREENSQKRLWCRVFSLSAEWTDRTSTNSSLDRFTLTPNCDREFILAETTEDEMRTRKLSTDKRATTDGTRAVIGCFIAQSVGGSYQDAILAAKFVNWYTLHAHAPD